MAFGLGEMPDTSNDQPKGSPNGEMPKLKMSVAEVRPADGDKL
jgi:hypothetical protein